MDKKQRVDIQWIQRAIAVAFLDALATLAAYMMALFLRFDFSFSHIPTQYIEGYLWSMPYWILITIVTFYIFRLYHSIWRFAGMTELWNVILAYMALLGFYIFGMIFMNLHMPRSYYFMGYLLSMCATVGIRFSYRLLRSYYNRSRRADATDRIMIIGAGQAGQVLIKELLNSQHLTTKVCCVIDDNPNKKGRTLEGVPIVGNCYIIGTTKKNPVFSSVCPIG